MSGKLLQWFDRAIAIAPRPEMQDSGAQDQGRRTDWLWLAGLLLAGLAFRLVVVVFLPSLYHPDETFQYWEQGYRLAFGAGIVPWEYRIGIRSFIVPGFIAGIFEAVTFLGGSVATGRFVVQLLLATLSLSIIVTAWAWARRAAGPGAALFAAFLAAFWYEFVYFAARPLTEIIAGALLFPAAYLLAVRNRPTTHYVFGVVLLALALVLRVQLLPVIGLVALVFARQHAPRSWIAPALAALAVLLTSGLLDWITWGAPFQSLWMNFIVNLVEDKASHYGTSPIFGYALLLANAWTGAIVIVVGLALFGMRRSPLAAALALTIIVLHSLIGHKEYRFIYPALPFIFTLVGIGTADLVARLTAGRGRRMRQAIKLGVLAGWLVTSVSIAGSTGFYGTLTERRAEIAAFERAGRIDGLCGLGLARIPWHTTPGTVGLGRPVPFYLLSDPEEVSQRAAGFNVIVYPKSMWDMPPEGYGKPDCVRQVCVAARQGGCTPMPGSDANAELIATGQ